MGALKEVVALPESRAPEWREPAALTLDERGMILDCSDSGEELFGYCRLDLIHQHVSKLLPQLAGVDLIQDGEPNAQLGFLCHIGHPFQFHDCNGGVFNSELSFVHLNHAGKSIVRLIARPFPTAGA